MELIFKSVQHLTGITFVHFHSFHDSESPLLLYNPTQTDSVSFNCTALKPLHPSAEEEF